jgi:hypothetical protein
MTEAILAPSELDVMAGLLQHLAEVFNHHDSGAMEDGAIEEDEMAAAGMPAVAAALVDLGCWIKLHRGESAVELVAFWLEKRGCRVPLD